MPKAKSTFRKTDVKRAILAAESAGMKVDRVEIDKTGRISLIPSQGAEAAADPDDRGGLRDQVGNPWDAATL